MPLPEPVDDTGLTTEVVGKDEDCPEQPLVVTWEGMGKQSSLLARERPWMLWSTEDTSDTASETRRC